MNTIQKDRCSCNYRCQQYRKVGVAVIIDMNTIQKGRCSCNYLHEQYRKIGVALIIDMNTPWHEMTTASDCTNNWVFLLKFFLEILIYRTMMITTVSDHREM